MFQVRISYNLHFPGHQDMHLTIPDLNLNVVADSYYLTLDQHFIPEEETFEKALIIFKSMLSQWILAVQKMYNQQTAYLPFDFADQGVGGFEVIKSENKLFIKYFIQDKIFNVSHDTDHELILYPSMSFNEMIYSSKMSNLRYINKEFDINLQDFVKEIIDEKKYIPLSRFPQ